MGFNSAFKVLKQTQLQWPFLSLCTFRENGDMHSDVDNIFKILINFCISLVFMLVYCKFVLAFHYCRISSINSTCLKVTVHTTSLNHLFTHGLFEDVFIFRVA
jgi:hypothetical protein